MKDKKGCETTEGTAKNSVLQKNILKHLELKKSGIAVTSTSYVDTNKSGFSLSHVQ
jgi:hypothetical protein